VNNRSEEVVALLYVSKHEVITGESQNVVLVVVQDRRKCKESVFVRNNRLPGLLLGLTRRKSDNNEEGGVEYV